MFWSFSAVICFLILSFEHAHSAPVATNPNVIIIGAGYAGLGAAERLIKHGFKNVRILEALNRPGGRVHTVQLGNGWVELGAQFVHSRVAETHEIAQKLGILSEAPESEGWSLRLSNGSIIPPLVEKYWDSYIDEVFEMVAEFPPNSSLQAALNLIYSKHQKEPAYEKYHLEYFPDYFESDQKRDLSAEDFEDVAVQSMTEYGAGNQYEDTLSGEGYGKITNYILNKLPSDTILYNKTVKNIQWNLRSGVRVTVEDGSIYLADHVIVTVSIGVLKVEHKTLFNPPLPPKKAGYIDTAGFGSVGKVFMQFSERFWPEDFMYFVPVNYKLFRLIKPKYALEEELNHSCSYTAEDLFMNIQALPEPENVLEFWIVLPELKLLNQLSEEELIIAFQTKTSKYLGRSKAAIPRPSKVLRTSWLEDPFFRGTYAYTTTKAMAGGFTRDHIISPLRVLDDSGRKIPRVLFAGEATSIRHWSTVHGARGSGQREADRLKKFLES